MDDVKSEIAKKRSENKSIYRKYTHTSSFVLFTIIVDKGTRKDNNQLLDEKALTQ